MNNTDTPSYLYRIYNFEYLLSDLKNGLLTLSHPKNFDDVREYKGSEPIYISSWSENIDTDAMWSIYSKDHLGVAVQFDIKKFNGLKFPNYLKPTLRKIEYINQYPFHKNSEEKEVLYKKRTAYEHEKEWRLILDWSEYSFIPYFENGIQYPRLIESYSNKLIRLVQLPLSIENWHKIISQIRVDPRASDDYLEYVKGQLYLLGIHADKIYRSNLYGQYSYTPHEQDNIQKDEWLAKSNPFLYGNTNFLFTMFSNKKYDVILWHLYQRDSELTKSEKYIYIYSYLFNLLENPIGLSFFRDHREDSLIKFTQCLQELKLNQPLHYFFLFFTNMIIYSRSLYNQDFQWDYNNYFVTQGARFISKIQSIPRMRHDVARQNYKKYKDIIKKIDSVAPEDKDKFIKKIINKIFDNEDIESFIKNMCNFYNTGVISRFGPLHSNEDSWEHLIKKIEIILNNIESVSLEDK